MVPIYFAGETLITYMSHNLAMTAITDTSNSIYNLVYRINGYSNNFILKQLDEMDIVSKINIVEALIKQIPENKYKEDTPIFIALHQLHKIVQDIEQLLKDMELEFKYHNTKWFSSWRGCNFNLDQLKTNYIKMDKRLDMFIKILNINDNLSIH